MNTTSLVHPTGVARSLDRGRAFWSRVAGVFESPWMSYGLIVILQLKVLWGLWSVADVKAGDTAYYYADAWRWYTSGHASFAWSPLYTAFYSLFLHINPNPDWANVSHRIAIVVGVAVLALAAFRQLLPPAVAWLCAAWWAVNPIAYDVMYEVHLFAMIPTLTAILLLASARTPWRRAAGLAVAGMTVVLCRNELSVALGVLGLGLAILEWRRLRRGEGHNLKGTLTAYALALSVAAMVCGFVYSRSSIHGEELAAEMKFKHTQSMQQMYATGYAARHPELNLRGMTQGAALVAETFGTYKPTLSEMIKANPRAVAEHWSWNLGLFPSGVELLLFNRASGSAHPDFLPASDPRLNHWWPAVLLGGLVVLWIAGLATIRREWATRWKEWLAPRAPAWFLMFGLACVVIPVTLTCRPRPAYMFGFGASLIVLTGLSAWAVATRLGVANLFRFALPVVAITLVAIMPTYANGRSAGIRSTAETLTRLEPHRQELAAPGVMLVGPSNGISLYVVPTARIRRYLSEPVCETLPNVLQFTTLEVGWQPGEPMHVVLDRIGANYLYVDERVMTLLERDHAREAKHILDGMNPPGWQLIETDNTPGRRWRFYKASRE